VKWLPLVFMCAIADPVSAATLEEIAHACASVHAAQAIFIGRPQPPTSINVSFEHKIEPARQKWLKAKEEASHSQDLAVQIKAIQASDDYQALRARYPAPMDMVLMPIHVETRFKGEVPDVVFMSLPGPDPLKPDRPYVFFTLFMMEMLDTRLVRPAGLPKPVEDDDAAVRVVRAATSAARGGVVLGWIATESPKDPGGSASPAAGINVRVETLGFVLDTSTDAQGMFMVTEVPSGPVTIRPALHERFTVANGLLGATVEEGGCVPFNLRAALNGRIRGRVVGRDGKPSAGLPLQLSLSSHARFVAIRDRLKTKTNANGEFEFRGLPPGEYVLGHNLYPDSDVIVFENGIVPTFYPGTSDRASAIPIVVGEGTEHNRLDFTLVR
jgi:hypothetical protein